MSFSGVAHLGRNVIAHRDLKADNLLLDLSGGSDFPLLVITDFGCCLTDEGRGLRLPYSTSHISKGGNVALMAPEVASARPGSFATIDYTMADVWAAGAIAYEIFGMQNPFYARTAEGKAVMDSRTYTCSDLPHLPEPTPPIVTHLVHAMLQRTPRHRMSAEMAATICQLLLWAPSRWSLDLPNTQEIMQWLITITTKIVCESRFSNSGPALIEYQLVASFLSRLSIREVRDALIWINDY
jgi:serine/threonine protein kinase